MLIKLFQSNSMIIHFRASSHEGGDCADGIQVPKHVPG